MVFNRGINTDVEPFLVTPEGKNIQYVTKTKLLGVIINEKLSTWDNTRYIEQKAFKRIWILKRLKALGCSIPELVTVYIRLVRSVCEYALPYWGTMISKQESVRIERIQRTAVHVILGDIFKSYMKALEICNLERLYDRRAGLIRNFAIKTCANPKFKSWFAKNTNPERELRRTLQTWKEPFTRTEKFHKSPIPHLTRILNGMESNGGEDDSTKCELCKICFSSLDNLSDHRRFKHSQENVPRWSNRVM